MTGWRSLAHGLLGGLLAVVLVVFLTGQSFIVPAGGASVPQSGIILDDSGSCPTGYTEVTAARGRFLVGVPSGGTVAGTLGTAMADLADSSFTPAGTNGTAAFTPAGTLDSVSAGTPAGTNSSDSAGTPAGTNSSDSAGTPAGTNSSDSAGTPAGTNSSDSAGTPAGTFTGSALGTHAHTNTVDQIGTTFLRGAGAVYGTGVAWTNGTKTAATANTDADGVAELVEPVSAGTPAGTFAGDALAGHTHTFSGSALAGHTHTFSGAALAGHTHTFSGAALAGHAHTFSGSALAGHAHTFTGGAGTVPAQTFTGTAVTTMRSATAPYLQLTLCKKS